MITIKTSRPSEKAFAWAVELTTLCAEAAGTPPQVVTNQLLTMVDMDAPAISKYIDMLQGIKSTLPKPMLNKVNVATLPYTPPAGQYMVNGEHLALKASKVHGGMLVYEKYAGYLGALAGPKCTEIAAALDSAEKAKACVIAYAKATGKCGVCNTKLTDPKSITAGIGPVCAKKYN